MKIRDPERKRQRWYKRRARQRNPIGKLLKSCYEEFRDAFQVPLVTPLRAQLRQTNLSGIQWGATNRYWDTVSPGTGLETTLDTAQAEVPVNYSSPVRDL